VPAHRAHTIVKCRKVKDLIVRDMWYTICLKMQHTVKEPRNVLLLHHVSESLHTLYCI